MLLLENMQKEYMQKDDAKKARVETLPQTAALYRLVRTSCEEKTPALKYLYFYICLLYFNLILFYKK